MINIASSGGHFDWWDGTEAFLVTESMALKNTAKLDPFVPSVKELGFYVNYTVYASKSILSGVNTDPRNVLLEPVYTVRSVLLSALGVPFYYLGLIFDISPITTVGLLFNSFIISITAVAIFCLSIEVYRSKKVAFLLSLIFSVCSFIWPYNSTFWVQPLQALTLVLSAYFLIKTQHYDKAFLCRYSILKGGKARFFFSILAGFFLGLSVLAHPTSLIFIPAFLVFSFFRVMRHDLRNFVLSVVALSSMLLVASVINYARFGSFTEFGYGYFSSLTTHNGWAGLIGLWVSPGAGLVFFFPLAVLLPLGAKYMYNGNRALFFLCAYIIVANWIYIGTLSFGAEPIAWSGGVAWGPRYFIPVLPFIMIILGSIFRVARKKRPILKITLVALCIVGFYVNLSGILIWFQYGLIYGWQQEGLAAFPNSLDIVTWYPSYSPIVLHTKALLSGYVSTIDPVQYVNTSWYWTNYGNAPCPVDLYFYCNYGVFPVLIIASVVLLFLSLALIRIGIFRRYLFGPGILRDTSIRNLKISKSRS
ncbi:MAG: rane protein of unknown function [Nitrososphaeraceae archaeon]|nr:rane protein of unknown function [Nitrososphaeraceae archaeon]